MDEEKLKIMRAEVTSLLADAKEQANTLVLLLAVAQASKVPRAEIETAIDNMKLHPLVSVSLKAGAKKLIPTYFP